MTNSQPKKKLLEKPLFASMVVPIAIVLVSAFIIFGVMKMLSSERTHRDLINEMHSKTFGNRWVAAYELSKLLAASKIPDSEKPWVIQNLAQIFSETPDARTRNFIIIALGTFNSDSILPTLEKALSDEDAQVKFNAVVTLGNLANTLNFDWNKIFPLLESNDPGLVQAAILALANHKVDRADQIILRHLKHSEISVRYAAATALINYQNSEASTTVEEILKLDADGEIKKFFNPVQVESLQLNVLNAIGRNKSHNYISLLQKVADENKNIRISTKAKEVLNLLKN